MSSSAAGPRPAARASSRSSSRMAHLLIYPMAYEGLEQSPNIIYTGAAPNQQVVPALSWCYYEIEGPEVLPGWFGLRLASLRERNRQGSAQGPRCRMRRRVVHPLRKF